MVDITDNSAPDVTEEEFKYSHDVLDRFRTALNKIPKKPQWALDMMNALTYAKSSVTNMYLAGINNPKPHLKLVWLS